MTAFGAARRRATAGGAYLDLHAGSAEASPRSAARQPDEAQATAALGKTLRATLDEPLVPALGWDGGKFTADAASYTAPGRMKLVRKAMSRAFSRRCLRSCCLWPAPVYRELSWLGD